MYNDCLLRFPLLLGFGFSCVVYYILLVEFYRHQVPYTHLDRKKKAENVKQRDRPSVLVRIHLIRTANKRENKSHYNNI